MTGAGINIAGEYNSGEHIIYTATQWGRLIMLSIVNEEVSNATVDVKRRVNGVDTKMVATMTIEPGEAAYIDNRVIKIGHEIIIVTDKTIQIDLNIV